tara:strand:- start:61 stop:258 length:198 start_codon:yes stop_codon:yes gene_type:complete
MPRGRTRPLVKPFPRSQTPKWDRQQLFIKLSNQRQDERSPVDAGDQALFGSPRSLYGIARYSSNS